MQFNVLAKKKEEIKPFYNLTHHKGKGSPGVFFIGL